MHLFSCPPSGNLASASNNGSRRLAAEGKMLRSRDSATLVKIAAGNVSRSDKAVARLAGGRAEPRAGAGIRAYGLAPMGCDGRDCTRRNGGAQVVDLADLRCGRCAMVAPGGVLARLART